MSESLQVTIVYEQGDEGWVVTSIPEVPGAHSQGRTREEARATLRRTSGSHHVYVHSEVRQLVNLQNVRGQAKPYQIRQFLRLVERYALSLEDEQ